jgi:hypothetical protein
MFIGSDIELQGFREDQQVSIVSLSACSGLLQPNSAFWRSTECYVMHWHQLPFWVCMLRVSYSACFEVQGAGLFGAWLQVNQPIIVTSVANGSRRSSLNLIGTDASHSPKSFGLVAVVLPLASSGRLSA